MKGYKMDGVILIVDDDEDIRTMLKIYLQNEGFSVILCQNAEEALEKIDTYKVELILLDIMMPGINGLEACVTIRQKAKMPIIFMSAKAEDMDKIQGLLLGADDYITKPFNPLELVTRVKVQLRRYKQYNETDNRDQLSYKDLILDKKMRQVWKKGKEIRLTPKEFQILEVLLEHKGMTLTVGQIYEHVWKEEFLCNENTVFMHISNLREKIEDDPQENQYIKTVWGKGYKI